MRKSSGGTQAEKPLLDKMKPSEGSLFAFPSFSLNGVHAILRHREAKRYTRFSARSLTPDPPGPPYTSSVQLASLCGVSPGMANIYLVFPQCECFLTALLMDAGLSYTFVQFMAKPQGCQGLGPRKKGNPTRDHLRILSYTYPPES